jgi:hypothetical protein
MGRDWERNMSREWEVRGGENEVMGKNLCCKTHKEWKARKKNKECLVVSPCQSLKPNFQLGF